MKIIPVTVYETAKAEFPAPHERVLGWSDSFKSPRSVSFRAKNMRWIWNSVTVRITYWTRFDFTEQTGVTNLPTGVDGAKRTSRARPHNNGA